VGCAQLERLVEVLAVKRRLAGRYAEVFADVDGLALIPEPSWARSNHWLNAVLLDDPEMRDPCLRACLDVGFGCRPLWQPMHQLEIYKDHPRAPDLGIAEQLVERVICLPSSENLGR
jgi:perosamine synthetase